MPKHADGWYNAAAAAAEWQGAADVGSWEHAPAVSAPRTFGRHYIDALEWSRDGPYRGRQKEKPAGDTSMWRDRGDDSAKCINSVRKMLRYELNRALRWTDALTAESAPADADLACDNLAHQYRRLYCLDMLNILVKDGKGARMSSNLR